jgi:signal transduction histidine kinase
MTPTDFGMIVAIALAASLIIALLGGLMLRIGRRMSLAAQIGVLVTSTAFAMVASIVAVAKWMLISAHDLTVVLYVAVVAGIVSLAFGLVLGRFVSRNLRSLTLAAQRIGEGGVVDSDSAVAGAEFRALAHELATTSQKLDTSRRREQRLESGRRDLVAGISHDLRTPLAGIRAVSEALEDGLVDDQSRYFGQMRLKVDQLTGMVDDLFELSKIDSGLLRLNITEVSLYDVVSDAVADLGPLAHSRDITVDAANREDLTVRADARELSRAINNLIVNAVQHTPVGSPISVVAGRSVDGRPSISVIDQGGGIADEDIERIFEPGWRATAARTPLAGGQTAGAGLGLAIVQGILRAHSGEAVASNVPGGCRFDLLLPI